MALHTMSDVEWWVERYKTDYLKNATSDVETPDDVAEVVERAIESFASEVKSACEDAAQEWWEEPCVTCGGDTRCIECDGSGVTLEETAIEDDEGEVLYYDDVETDCTVCGGHGECLDCDGTGLAHRGA